MHKNIYLNHLNQVNQVAFKSFAIISNTAKKQA